MNYVWGVETVMVISEFTYYAPIRNLFMLVICHIRTGKTKIGLKSLFSKAILFVH